MSTGLIDTDGRPISGKAIARIRQRASLHGGQSFAYDGAVIASQSMDGWNPYIRSPDGEINDHRDRMVARARDLLRNDGYAAGLINRLLDAAIGASFEPIPQPNWRVLSRYASALDATWAAEFAAAVRAEWQLWAEDTACHADAERTLTVPQMFRLAFRHKLVDGEGLIALLWTPERVGGGAARYATALQVVDPDRLSNPYQAIDTHNRRGGVEVDPLGAPVGYHLRRAHQADWFDATAAMVWDYFPRETPWGRPIVVHDFDRERAGQHRGVGLLTPVLAQFKMRAKLDMVTLQAAALRAVLGFFVKSPYDAEQIRMAMEAEADSAQKLEPSYYQDMRAAWHGEHDVSVGGVRVPILAPGESMETVSGGERATDFDVFQSAFLRCFAAASGQSAEEVSGDFRETNYSSHRGAVLQAWRTLLRRRRDFQVNTATPVYAAFLEEALDARLRDLMPRNAPSFAELRAAYARAMWIGPGRGWVDPVKESQGAILQLQAGMTTLSEVTAGVSGRYWLDVLDERAVEEAAMRERGMTLPDWAGGQGMRPDQAESADRTEAADRAERADA